MAEQVQQVQSQVHLLQEQVAEVEADTFKQQVVQAVQVVAEQVQVQATKQEEVQQIQVAEVAVVSMFLVPLQVWVEKVVQVLLLLKKLQPNQQVVCGA
tara:strand:- start:62 stop:355 length:294 start_codon:yes stop_codon:yes gene_type:complete